MASLRKIRRRHRTWQRYHNRYRAIRGIVHPRGYWATWDALLDERARRIHIAGQRYELASAGRGPIEDARVDVRLGIL